MWGDGHARTGRRVRMRGGPVAVHARAAAGAPLRQLHAADLEHARYTYILLDENDVTWRPTHERW